MCGIAGFLSDKAQAPQWVKHATQQLIRRGPDFQNTWHHGRVHLGHARLSIIDTSEAGHQPMTDATGRCTIVYNGEIYNFRKLRQMLEANGYHFHSHTDTEVLLNAYLHFGLDFLQELNGFFAFAIYDKERDRLLLARDRMGIKPLLYARNGNELAFASEMKAMRQLLDKPEMDPVSLWQYLQLNYIPAPDSIYRNVKKLLPGHALLMDNGTVKVWQYYDLQAHISNPVDIDKGQRVPPDYTTAQQQLREKLEASVEKRLMADVPLGAFLSGGIDSSVIVALAAKHVERLHTFSIGFRDADYYDETAFAGLVSQRYNTEHTVFKLTMEEVYSELDNALSYLDEPFADSSALLVHILSKRTREHVKVALSGDGGDELFAGYHKHYGEWRMRQGGWKAMAVQSLAPLWKILPKSRHSGLTNKFRQLDRFARANALSPAERYWQWCCISESEQAAQLMAPGFREELRDELESRKQRFLRHIHPGGDFNEVLYADTQMVLPNDMLTKVDLMSMANSLEVRVPFLDHEVAEFAFSLPPEYKINGRMKKRIVQDAFRDMLPDELYNRPKKGFEIPLLQWMRGGLKDLLFNELLGKEALEEQGLFNYAEIDKLHQQLFSNNPGDAPARLYALMVFQKWEIERR